MPFLKQSDSRRPRDFAAALFLLLALGLLLPVKSRGEVVDRIVAVVNNDIILQSDLQQAFVPLRERLRREGYTEARQDLILDDQRPQVLEQMIVEKLTDQKVAQNKIQIRDTEVDATITRIREVNNLDTEDFQRMIELEGLDMASYREKVKEQLLRTKLVNYEVKSKIVITDAEVSAAYEKHKARYGGQTQYQLRHILVKSSPEADRTQREQALQKVRSLQARIKAGESFTDLAADYSEAGSAAKGGELGYLDEHLLADPIQEALRPLQKGQLSDVVDTEQGYQLFLLEDVRRADGKTFEEVKDEIYEQLYAQIIDQKFQAWLQDIRERAHVQIIDE